MLERCTYSKLRKCLRCDFPEPSLNKKSSNLLFEQTE